MLFNSLVFAAFLPTVFALYWLLQRGPLRAQNLLLLIVSYVFYGWWDYRFLSLLLISSCADYVIGQRMAIAHSRKTRKTLLITSLCINLGVLGFFKYFNFFSSSFAALLRSIGLHASAPTLQVVLPVGISFYTFQTLSYTIDIYRKRLQPKRDPVAFFAYVSFFPQLVAGPIERARSLLPQFERHRTFCAATATDGLRQMLWGFAKKVVIADNVALYVDQIFAAHGTMSGALLIYGVVLFAVQIYCDFSGYSDIAIGVAKLFGFTLMRNFAYPYFSRDIAEFWRRWHISLSTWFRDYLYIPLGGSRTSRANRIRNIVITFVVSGFWHGANWTFIAWGLLHGLYYLPIMLVGANRKNLDSVAGQRLLPSPRELLQIAWTLVLVLIAWVFFRAESVSDALSYLGNVVSAPFTGVPLPPKIMFTAVLIGPFFLIEWLQRDKQHALDVSGWYRPMRWVAYLAVGLALLELGHFGETQFIYFQF